MNDEDMNDLVWLWKEYATEKDENLTKEAIELKKDIIAFVRTLPKYPFAFREGCFRKNTSQKHAVNRH